MTSATIRSSGARGRSPFWSLAMIAMDVVALWGLCAYGSREILATA